MVSDEGRGRLWPKTKRVSDGTGGGGATSKAWRQKLVYEGLFLSSAQYSMIRDKGLLQRSQSDVSDQRPGMIQWWPKKAPTSA